MNHREMRNPMSEIFSDDDSARLFQLIHMFQRSALVNMGLMPDIEGKIIYNLPESKEAIDLLCMLQKKTKGNITDIEQKMLNGIISEIQLQFISAPKRRKEHEEFLAESKMVEEAFSDPKHGPSETIISEEE